MVNAGRKPELIVIAGPYGSGKTSVTKKFLHHEWADGTVYINPDQIANDKFGDWNSQTAVLEAANYCAEWREQCLRDKVSFVFETVFSAKEKIDNDNSPLKNKYQLSRIRQKAKDFIDKLSI